MDALRIRHVPSDPLDLTSLSPELTDWDKEAFRAITSVELTPDQQERVANPTTSFPRQSEVFAVHWHPEFIPMDLIRQRVRRMFPNAERELIIPTQHNVLLEHDGYVGVEIDCYSAGFNRKVQLLAHFNAAKVRDAHVFKAMLDHTRRYRAGQLHEFVDSVVEPQHDARVAEAAEQTGASPELVEFVRVQTRKLKQLIERHERDVEPDMLKNKLVRYYFDALRGVVDPAAVTHAQFFLRAVKQLVKRDFALTYFYRTEEVIEEVRALGGAIVIPHPEQFWPILLADYDIDGIEVWNPQSQEYTQFLIHCVYERNKAHPRQRPVLITMGDDTHFGEKVLDPAHQDPAKANRELGVQPAWDDLNIRKSLIVADADRGALIEDYIGRLG